MIYLASDHAGFELKTKVKSYLAEKSLDFEDIGCDSAESCAYSDFAHELAEKIIETGQRGIGICGNGIGISMALNRHPGIRAARCLTPDDARMTRLHNDANVIALGGRITDLETAKQIIDNFLQTEFEGGRHEDRVKKIELS